MYVCTYILCPNYEDPSRETRFRIHMYVCIYVCIYRERACVCKKQVDCLWKQICVPHMHACTYCVCGRACVRACGQACVCVASRYTPTAAEYLPASQLVQTVEPAIYVHTLSHTTKGGAR
jgi:hypothetical protein